MYQIIIPSKSLQPYIECYWLLNVAAPNGFEVSESIFVDGKADLIFNFGDPYRRRGAGDPLLQRRSNLDALREYPVEITQSGQVSLVGVRFKPGGMTPFVDIPAVELKNQLLDIESGFGPEIKTIEARLYDLVGEPLKQAALLDSFFKGRFESHKDAKLAEAIAESIVLNRGQITINALSERFAYSSRHINRVYQAVYGLSPKFHARVERVQGVLAYLVKQPDITPVELSLTCGYYDQSHLSKEFAAFTGHSLHQYRDIIETKRASAPPPNLVRFLQD